MMQKCDRDLADACRSGYLAGIKAALAAGADVNFRGVTGLTSVLRLVRSLRRSEFLEPCLNELLDSGAIAYFREWHRGETPLIALCRQQRPDKRIVRMATRLIEAAPGVLDAVDHSDRTALSHVCGWAGSRWWWTPHSPKLVQVLLAYGAKTNVGKHLPLAAAVGAHDSYLATMLLRKEADPRIPEAGTNESPLKVIVLRNRWRRTIKLFEKRYPGAVARIRAEARSA